MGSIRANSLPVVAPLPARRGESWLHFLPSETARGGLLVISDDRLRSSYALVEITAHGGRGYRLIKRFGATNPEDASEDVFLSDRPGYDTCSCRGFQRHGRCKHLLSLRLLAELGAFSEDETPTNANPFPPDSPEYADFEAGRAEARGDDDTDEIDLQEIAEEYRAADGDRDQVEPECEIL